MKIRNLIIFLFFSLGLYAQAYTPQTVPNPKDLTHNDWISDPAHYLSPTDYDSINEVCVNLKSMVNVELAVVLLPNIDQRYDAFDFCQELFNMWGIGGAEHNTGVLLFFCEETRDIRIHTGGGMEGLLPDVTCDDIINHSISYLSDGDYSKGISSICYDIEQQLLTDEAKAELLLGYKPKTNDARDNFCRYFTFCILLMVAMCYAIYRRVPQKASEVPIGRRDQEAKDLAQPQTLSGCSAWFFPFPMLFIYLFFRIKRKKILTAPSECPKCGGKMSRASEEEMKNYLNASQLKEYTLKSLDYMVWHCPTCNHNSISHTDGRYSIKYTKCPDCNTMALKIVNTQTLQSPSYSHAGSGVRDYECMFCGHTHSEKYTIPRLVESSSSSSRSYGGSSRSSGGSWGGGRSYGGGAGRKF